MRRVVATLALALVAALPIEAVRAASPSAGSGRIDGVVTNSKTRAPIPNAVVVLQCTCLTGARETATDARGRYAFAGLGPGMYTVQVLVHQADVTKVIVLPAAKSMASSRSYRDGQHSRAHGRIGSGGFAPPIVNTASNRGRSSFSTFGASRTPTTTRSGCAINREYTYATS